MTGVTYPRHYEVVTYPEGQEGTEGWGGFQARIMANPNGAERRHATRLFKAYVSPPKSTDGKPGGMTVEAEDEYWQYVAPWIVEWNFEVRQEDGSTIAYPPPAEQWDVVYELEPIVMLWLSMQIQIAYLPKAKAPTAAPDSASDAGSSDGTQPIPIPRTNSSTPSASTLSA
jgi:hypothetical protein